MALMSPAGSSECRVALARHLCGDRPARLTFADSIGRGPRFSWLMQCPSGATAERRSPCHYLASGSDRAGAMPGPVVALQRLLRPLGGTPSQTRPLAVSDGQQGLQPRTLLLRPGDRSGMESRICRFRAGFAMLIQPLKPQEKPRRWWHPVDAAPGLAASRRHAVAEANQV